MSVSAKDSGLSVILWREKRWLLSQAAKSKYVVKDDGDHSRKHPVSLQNSLLHGETCGDCSLLRLRHYPSSCADYSETTEFPSICTSEAISTAGDRVLETSIWTKCWRRAVSTSTESFPIALFSVRHWLSPRRSWHIFQAEAFHKQRVLTHGIQDYEILIWCHELLKVTENKEKCWTKHL